MDIIQPLLSADDIKDKNCADTARIVLMILAAGARSVTAIEPSRAYSILVQTPRRRVTGHRSHPASAIAAAVNYLSDVYMRFSPAERRLIILDQINPRWAKYYTREEAEALSVDAGFRDVQMHHRHGYSWTRIEAESMTSARHGRG